MARSIEDVFMVLTANSVEEIVRRGGVAYWIADAQRVGGCRYVIAARNRNDRHEEPGGEEEHGAAFFIGEIGKGIYTRDEPGYERRIIVGVTRFARVDIPGVWAPRGSNPVRYGSMSELPVELDSLRWVPWPRARAVRGLVKVIEL
ncbi:hypothetical protein [Trinickia soli]|nr:hypothetical protein [Trinickia soli]CAB3663090.1 hypothetical protein LMG24076_01551 [Trinickia soli]